ncbi:MAG: hypothetical protein ABI270_05570 [Nitrosospira sp.]
MTQYVLYIRTVDGHVERKECAIFDAHGSIEPYVHAEVLVGWPETKVFWDHGTGPSVGIAISNADTLENFEPSTDTAEINTRVRRISK